MTQKLDLNDELFEVVGKKREESETIHRESISMWKESWIRLRNNKAAMISLFILITITAMAIFAPVFSQYSYYDTNYDKVYQTPSAEHWFGTDKFGRDQWVRVWEGTRISLFIAILAATLDLIIGVTYGSVSAIYGGKIDNIMQRFIEVLIGIPNLVIIILLMMVLKPGIITLTVAMVLTGWVTMARLVRAQIFKLKNQEFILASRSLGSSNKRLIWHHLIPNTLGLIIINMMFTIPTAIFTEAFLSFIGLGLQEPQASLGVLINDGYQAMRNYFYLLLWPAVIIVLLMISFNLLADGLRDALDPKMRK